MSPKMGQNVLIGPAKGIAKLNKSWGPSKDKDYVLKSWVQIGAQIIPKVMNLRPNSWNLQCKSMKFDEKNNEKWPRSVELAYIRFNGWFPTLYHVPSSKEIREIEWIRGF